MLVLYNSKPSSILQHRVNDALHRHKKLQEMLRKGLLWRVRESRCICIVGIYIGKSKKMLV